jgi:hypothetical protein
MLLKKFLESFDADHAKCYVHSSRFGKSLYEKFGFKTMGVLAIDLQEFGDYEPYTTWDMQREAEWDPRVSKFGSYVNGSADAGARCYAWANWISVARIVTEVGA